MVAPNPPYGQRCIALFVEVVHAGLHQPVVFAHSASVEKGSGSEGGAFFAERLLHVLLLRTPPAATLIPGMLTSQTLLRRRPLSYRFPAFRAFCSV